jgi:hypothetical protein
MDLREEDQPIGESVSFSVDGNPDSRGGMRKGEISCCSAASFDSVERSRRRGSRQRARSRCPSPQAGVPSLCMYFAGKRSVKLARPLREEDDLTHAAIISPIGKLGSTNKLRDDDDEAVAIEAERKEQAESLAPLANASMSLGGSLSKIGSRVSSRESTAKVDNGPTAQDILLRAETARQKEAQAREKHLAKLLPHERSALQREERVKAMWEQRQREWARLRRAQARRTGREESKTVIARTDEWREVVEEYDILQKAAPSDERHGAEGWAMSLRGGGERYILIGNIFNGLYVPVKENHAPLAEVVRRPMKYGEPTAATTLPSSRSQMTSSTQAIGQLAYGKNWRDAPALRRRRRQLKRSIKKLRPHELPVDATDALCLIGEGLLEWARRSHAQAPKPSLPDGGFAAWSKADQWEVEGVDAHVSAADSFEEEGDAEPRSRGSSPSNPAVGFTEVESFHLPSVMAERKASRGSTGVDAAAPAPGPNLLARVLRDAVVLGSDLSITTASDAADHATEEALPLEAGVRRITQRDLQRGYLSGPLGEVAAVGAPSGGGAGAARGWPRVSFETTSNTQAVVSAVRLFNTGTTVVYYSVEPQRQASATSTDPRAAVIAAPPQFACSNKTGSILPGRFVDLSFSFHTRTAGVFRETWVVTTRPTVNGGAPFRLALRGVATEADELGPKRAALEQRLSHQVAELAAREAMDSVLDRLVLPADPLTEEEQREQQLQKWEAHNDGLVFVPSFWDALEGAGADAAALQRTGGQHLRLEANRRNQEAVEAWVKTLSDPHPDAAKWAILVEPCNWKLVQEAGVLSEPAEEPTPRGKGKASSPEASPRKSQVEVKRQELVRAIAAADADAEVASSDASDVSGAFEWDGRLSSLDFAFQDMVPMPWTEAEQEERRARSALVVALRALKSEGEGGKKPAGKGGKPPAKGAKGEPDVSAQPPPPRLLNRAAVFRSVLGGLRGKILLTAKECLNPRPEHSPVFSLARQIVGQMADAVPVVAAVARRLAGAELSEEQLALVKEVPENEMLQSVAVLSFGKRGLQELELLAERDRRREAAMARRQRKAEARGVDPSTLSLTEIEDPELDDLDDEDDDDEEDDEDLVPGGDVSEVLEARDAVLSSCIAMDAAVRAARAARAQAKKAEEEEEAKTASAKGGKAPAKAKGKTKGGKPEDEASAAELAEARSAVEDAKAAVAAVLQRSATESVLPRSIASALMGGMLEGEDVFHGELAGEDALKAVKGAGLSSAGWSQGLPPRVNGPAQLDPNNATVVAEAARLEAMKGSLHGVARVVAHTVAKFGEAASQQAQLDLLDGRRHDGSSLQGVIGEWPSLESKAVLLVTNLDIPLLSSEGPSSLDEDSGVGSFEEDSLVQEDVRSHERIAAVANEQAQDARRKATSAVFVDDASTEALLATTQLQSLVASLKRAMDGGASRVTVIGSQGSPSFVPIPQVADPISAASKTWSAAASEREAQICAIEEQDAAHVAAVEAALGEAADAGAREDTGLRALLARSLLRDAQRAAVEDALSSSGIAAEALAVDGSWEAAAVALFTLGRKLLSKEGTASEAYSALAALPSLSGAVPVRPTSFRGVCRAIAQAMKQQVALVRADGTVDVFGASAAETAAAAGGSSSVGSLVQGAREAGEVARIVVVENLLACGGAVTAAELAAGALWSVDSSLLCGHQQGRAYSFGHVDLGVLDWLDVSQWGHAELALWLRRCASLMGSTRRQVVERWTAFALSMMKSSQSVHEVVSTGSERGFWQQLGASRVEAGVLAQAAKALAVRHRWEEARGVHRGEMDSREAVWRQRFRLCAEATALQAGLSSLGEVVIQDNLDVLAGCGRVSGRVHALRARATRALAQDDEARSRFTHGMLLHERTSKAPLAPTREAEQLPTPLVAGSSLVRSTALLRLLLEQPSIPKAWSAGSSSKSAGSKFPVVNGLQRPVVGVVGGRPGPGYDSMMSAAHSLESLAWRCDALVLGGAVGAAWSAVNCGVSMEATEHAWFRSFGGCASPLAAAASVLQRAAKVARARGVQVYAPVDHVTGTTPVVCVPPALAEFDESEAVDMIEDKYNLALDGRAVGKEEEEVDEIDSDDDEGWINLRHTREHRRRVRRVLRTKLAARCSQRQERAADSQAHWSLLTDGDAPLSLHATAALRSSAAGSVGTVEIGASVGQFEYLSTAPPAIETADIVESRKAFDQALSRFQEVDTTPLDDITLDSEVIGAARALVGVGLPSVKGIVLDIGPKSRERAVEVLEKAGTIVWAGGALGVVEIEDFAEGTREVAAACVAAIRGGANALVGGGAACAAVREAGLPAASDSVALVPHCHAVRAVLAGRSPACVWFQPASE